MPSMFRNRRRRSFALAAVAGGLALCGTIFVSFGNGTAHADDAIAYAPSKCDFGVIFPGEPHHVPIAEHRGRKTASAVIETASARLSASCTTGYPPGYFADVSDEELAEFVTSRISVEDPEVQVERVRGFPRVLVMGDVEYGGRAFVVRTLVAYGPTSRFTVEAITSMNEEGGQGGGDVAGRFLDSIYVK